MCVFEREGEGEGTERESEEERDGDEWRVSQVLRLSPG